MEQPSIRGLILRLEKAFIKDMSNLCSLYFIISKSSKLSMHFMIKFFCIIIQKQIHTINIKALFVSHYFIVDYLGTQPCQETKLSQGIPEL